MANTQTFNTSTTVTTAAINSTKAVVVCNVAVYCAVGGTVTSTSPILVPQLKNNVNMQGVGNTLTLMPVGSGPAAVTVTQIGTVYASSVAQNNTTYLNP